MPTRQPARWPGRPNDTRRGDTTRHHTQATAPVIRRGGPSLYQTVLRQAIASQHQVTPSDRQELHACEGCRKPYLLTSLWQPHSDEGAIACPRCGTEAVTWEGARGYVVYWHRESERTPGNGMIRPPIPSLALAPPLRDGEGAGAEE
jgi:hypothetical protein